MEERHTVETKVGRLAVRVVGDGPTAVLWPSLFMDERSWDRLLPTLTKDRRLVIINGPGHGASGDPGRRYSNHDCVTAAGQVLDRLAIGSAVDWVGNAWGGHVGLRFAADRPGRCRSLITLGTPVAALSRGERRRTYPLLVVHGVLGPIDLVLSGVTEVLLSTHTRAHDPEAVELVRDSLRHANRRMLRNAVMSISLRREDLTDVLPEISAPTFVITGSDHSGFTPAQAEAAARLIRNGRTAVVPDAAYLVPLEAPALTSTLIREFWAQRSQRQPLVGPQRILPDRGGLELGQTAINGEHVAVDQPSTQAVRHRHAVGDEQHAPEHQLRTVQVQLERTGEQPPVRPDHELGDGGQVLGRDRHRQDRLEGELTEGVVRPGAALPGVLAAEEPGADARQPVVGARADRPAVVSEEPEDLGEHASRPDRDRRRARRAACGPR